MHDEMDFLPPFVFQAGLVPPDCPEQLLIALEPEAASIYCRKLRLHQVMDLSLQPITNGLEVEGSRPFDSSFRQGSRGRGERERLLFSLPVGVLFSTLSLGWKRSVFLEMLWASSTWGLWLLAKGEVWMCVFVCFGYNREQ